MGFYGLLGVGLLGLTLLIGIAWRLGARRTEREAEAPKGLEAVSGALFGLFGLLLAFSFSASASRFEHRRTISIDEANAIGTAALRLDVLPAASRDEAREQFRVYLDSRTSYLETVNASGDLERAWAEVTVAQDALWKIISTSVPSDRQLPVHTILMPALNEMFDIAATRHVAIQTHLPAAIIGLLSAFAVVTAYLGGRLARRRSFGILYAICVVATLWVMIDIDYPRRGLIRANNADQLIEDIREGL